MKAVTKQRRFYCPSKQLFYDDFPPTTLALEGGDCDGLLCLSDDGTLTVDWLMKAYALGIFPWSEENEQGVVVWFAPAQRPVFRLPPWKPSRSIKRLVRRYDQQGCQLTVNQNFAQVMEGCADRENTWITPALKNALMSLHQRGKAFSFEVKNTDNPQALLIGGLYGIAHHPVFFAESMFSRQDGASKYAFFGMVSYLMERGYVLVDAQIPSPHLQLLGCETIRRETLQTYLK